MIFILLLAVLGSVIPTIIYVCIAWWLDRYEKEPLWLLALTFLWGAVPAVIFSAIAEFVLMIPLQTPPLADDGMMVSTEVAEQRYATTMKISMAVIAPIVEEILKGTALLMIFFVFRRKFDGLMDGLIYGAMVGFGFAMVENFLYIFSTGQSSGLAAEAVIFFLRTIVFGMMHALWSSMFGVGLGIARYARSNWVAILAPALGLMLGMLLHSLHNYSAVSTALQPETATFWVPLMLTSYATGCFAWLLLVFLAGLGEAALIREELADEITSGILTPEQARACGRYRSRVATRWAAVKEHGYGRAHQLGLLYCLGAELAFKKRQSELHPMELRYAEEVGRLRTAIVELREGIA